MKLNIHEAKTHLSRYLKRLEKGEVITLCRRNEPIAEIVPCRRRAPNQGPIGLAKGLITVLPGFFDRLPKELEDAFNGESP